MQGCGFHIARSNRLPLALLALICVSLFLWPWEKAPLMSSLLPSFEQFSILTPVTDVPTRTSSSADKKSSRDSIGSLPSKEMEHVPIFLTNDSLASDSALKETNVEDKECNFAKGRWVADSIRPLYSGSACKQWLSPMWACRLMKRPDFSYEGFRWQPQGCKVPEFSRSSFLSRMHNKTIALIGDSLGRQQFQSLMCMVTGGELSPEVEDVGIDYGLVKAPGALRPDGWVYRFLSTNTTILFYWSASLCELEPLNTSGPSTHYALHLDRPVTFLKQHLPRFDVLVLNTGHHWNRDKFRGNQWELYARGKPVVDGEELADLRNAKNFTLHSIARWVDSQIKRRPQLKAFLRTISPRHFVNGDWNTGGSCNNTVPLAGGSEVSQNSSNDPIPEAAVKGTRVKLLDITALSQLRDEGHVSKYTVKAILGVHDCLHWCLPGIPDAWNEILCAQL